MPNKRQRTTTRGAYTLTQYEAAYEDLKKGCSLRIAAEKHGLNFSSLNRYSKKRKISGEDSKAAVIKMGYFAHNRVFVDSQEKILAKYLQRCYDIYFGLSTAEVRKLAFKLAVVMDLNRPCSWDINKSAGLDWFRAFVSRNPDLSAKVAQSAKLAIATSFNRTHVDAFYDNLESVMERYQFKAEDIYNVYEMGITSMQKPDRVVARRERSLIKKADRRTFVTLAFTANAVGNVLPLMFVFPRLKFHNHFLDDGPVGAVGAANAYGWLQNDSFLKFLKNFKCHTKASVDHKVLLLIDNQSSRIQINCLDYCKGNGIVLLSFPPYCSHKLQPLDRSSYSSFKEAINSSCEAWVREHPEKKMTIDNIPSIVADAMPKVSSSNDIIDGFQKTGVSPMNRNLFTDLDFEQNCESSPFCTENENK